MPDLDGFDDWLRRRGRAASTCRQYRRVVERLLAEEDASEVLLDRSKSPMYRHSLQAALRAWAVYCGDGELVRTLEEIRLPARIPKSPREPLAQDDWFAVVDAIEQNESVTGAMRAVLCLIAVRGIRCGDVLRLTRREIKSALKTGTLAFEAKGERRVEYSAEPLRPYLEALLDESWSGRKRVRELIAPSAADETQQESAARAVRRAFGQVADDLGLEPGTLYAHRFRHTYVHHFLSELRGDPEALVKLQDQMGWARLETAGSYLRRARRKELDAVESKLLSGRKR